MSEEKLLAKINSGKMAEMSLKFLDPILLERRESIITTMKNRYSEGTLDEKGAFCLVAGLVELDVLRSKFNYQIKAGERATREVYRED